MSAIPRVQYTTGRGWQWIWIILNCNKLSTVQLHPVWPCRDSSRQYFVLHTRWLVWFYLLSFDKRTPRKEFKAVKSWNIFYQYFAQVCRCANCAEKWRPGMIIWWSDQFTQLAREEPEGPHSANCSSWESILGVNNSIVQSIFVLTLSIIRYYTGDVNSALWTEKTTTSWYQEIHDGLHLCEWSDVIRHLSSSQWSVEDRGGAA